jgi:anti-anti-sigma factor
MNPLEFKTQGDVCVVRVPESLDQHDYLELRSYFKSEFFDKGKFKIVLDCGAIDEFPSIAFGVFCSLARDSKRLGGFCNLARVSDSMFSIMKKIHIDQQINAFSTIKEAVGK